MINKQEEDTLMTAFDALDADLGKLLAHYRKLKRDRKALLEACKAALRSTGCDGDLCFYESHELMRQAIAQAESEE